MPFSWPRRFSLFVFAVLGIATFARLASASSASECFLVSGLKRDHNGAFSSIKTNLSRYSKRCKIVSSWKEVVPTSSSAPVLVIQAAHGSSGGRAFCDAGEESPEEIIGRMTELSRSHSIGVYLQSCFSGDLLRRILVEDQKLLKRACLITSSSLNRSSFSESGITQGGVATTEATDRLISLVPGKNLNDFFASETQGLSSASAWEANGFLDLMLNYGVTQPLLSEIQRSLHPTYTCNSLNRGSARSTLLRICNGVTPTDLKMIMARSGIESHYANLKRSLEGVSASDLSDNDDLRGRARMRDAYLQELIQTAKNLSIAKKSLTREMIIARCRDEETPLTCVVNELARGRGCQHLTETARRTLARALLGEDSEIQRATNSGLGSDAPQNDPVHFLHDFSVETAVRPKWMSPADRARNKACQDFVVN